MDHIQKGYVSTGDDVDYTLACVKHGKLQEETLGDTPMAVELGKETPPEEGQTATDGLTKTKGANKDAGTTGSGD